MNFGMNKLQLGNIGSPYNRPGVPQNIRLRTTPGINLGMIANLRLNNNMDLRMVPAVSLQERRFEYIFTGTQGDSIVNRRLEAAYVDIPLMLKFKSDFYHNHRVYVMFGGKFSYNLVSDARAVNDPDLLKILRTDFSLEFAFGIDLYSDRVKLCPEIRYSLGLLDVYTAQFTTFGDAIAGLSTHTITLSFNFE
jgi:hypothetical protein